MSQNGKPDDTVRDPIATMEALVDDAAEQAAEDYVPTEDDVRWARELGATVEQRLASLERRPLRAPEDGFSRPVIIPEEIQVMDRATVLVRLEILRLDPNVQYANSNLKGLSDDDLRRLLVLLMSSAKG